MAVVARVDGWRAVVLLLAGIALCAGLIGMHHLSIGDDGATSTVSPSTMTPGSEQHEDRQVPPTHDDDGSALLHLCFAVLTAAVSAFLLVLALGRPRVWASGNTVREAAAHPRSRAPPLATSRRLSVLCVMRN